MNFTYIGGAMRSPTKFSQDIVPLSDLKVNPGRIVHQVDETRRPVLLTNRGRGVAVVQALAEYETESEEQAFLRGVVQGLMDLEEKREMDLSAVKIRLGLT
jgi:prevent-host-death family protein